MDNNVLTIALAHAGLFADAGIDNISLLDIAKSALAEGGRHSKQACCECRHGLTISGIQRNPG
jgi:hypothetical protein